MTLDGHAATLARSLVHPSALPAAGSAAAAATPSMYRWSMTRGGHRRSCLPTRNQSKGIAIRPSRVCGSIRTFWLRNVCPPPAGSVVFRRLSCLPACARGSLGTGRAPTNLLIGPHSAASPTPRCADRGPRSWSVGGPPSGLSLLRGFLCGLCCRRAMGAAAPLPAT